MHGLEVKAQGLHATAPGPVPPEVGTRGVPLLVRGPRQIDGLRPGPADLSRLRHGPQHPAAEVGGPTETLTERVACGSDQPDRFHGRLVDHGVEIDIGGTSAALGGRVGEGHLDERLTVADRVMDLGQQRTTAIGQTIHHDVHPERSRAIVRILQPHAEVVEEFAERTAARCADASDVPVEVELVIVNPARGRQGCQSGLDPLAETGHVDDRSAHRPSEPLDVERTIEETDTAAVGVEPWIALDVPHHRFHVAHVPVAHTTSLPARVREPRSDATSPWTVSRRGFRRSRHRCRLGTGSWCVLRSRRR
jgi:hypothetical protein